MKITMIKASVYHCSECLAMFDSAWDTHSKTIRLTHPSDAQVWGRDCHLVGASYFVRPDYVEVTPSGKLEPVAS